MNDPQLREFFGRLHRIEKIHRRGGGFEADGTLGQSYYTKLRLQNQRRPILRPAVVFVSVILLFKSVLLAAIGEQAYAEKLVGLRQGDIVEQVGAFIMAVDPLTSTLAAILAPYFG